MLSALREVQLPLLAALLIGAGAAKSRQVFAPAPGEARTSPTALFPVRLRRPAGIALCAGEIALGTGLLVTAGRLGAGLPAHAIRVATALLFLTGAGSLHLLRTRRPDAGCGCFGDISAAPVDWRTLTRAILLGAAAVATLDAPPLTMPRSAAGASLLLAAGGGQLAVLAALSPEIGVILGRLGHPEPCEVRRIPVAHTMSALRSSTPWRRWSRHLLATEPTDMWREGCWRFIVFPGTLAGRRCDVVFAVYMATGHATVRVGALETVPRYPVLRITEPPAMLRISSRV